MICQYKVNINLDERFDEKPLRADEVKHLTLGPVNIFRLFVHAFIYLLFNTSSSHN